MLSRRNAAAFLVLTVAFASSIFILTTSETAEAVGTVSDRMCGNWHAECGCGQVPNPDKTAKEKCIKGANTNKCAEGICFDDTNGHHTTGICTAKNTCKALHCDGKPCGGQPQQTPQTPETPQTGTPPQTPQTPQTPAPDGGQPPQTPTPQNPEKQPEPTIPAGCDLVSGAGCMPQSAEPTPRTDGAATNPWLTGERPAEPSTSGDPNALTPATTQEPATRSVAPTNPFGEQIQTAQEAQRGGFWSNLYDSVFGPPASITPPPSADTASDPMTGSLYNNVVQPDLGTMTGFDPPPSATAGTTPTESAPTGTSWRDTLSNAWDTVRDTATGAYETLATTATDAYNGARDMFGFTDTPPSEPLALEPSQDVSPTPTTASYGADELTTAEREAYEAAQAAAQPRDPEIVAAENAILQDRLAQADRETAAYEKALAEAGDRIPAPTPAEVTPESIQRQVEADIASRVPVTEPAVTDPQREVEKQIARDILAGDRTLPPVRTDGPSAQELTRQIQESKEQRIDPVVARVEESNERLRQMNGEFERLERERQRFVDQNAANVDREGRPIFTRQADVDAYNRIVGEQQQLQTNFRGEDVTNQALRSELTDRVGQHNELVQQLQAMPAENRLISALQTERTSLGEQITAATERRDALTRELAATPYNPEPNPDPLDSRIPQDPARQALESQIKAENDRIAQLQQQARFNETLQSCLSNCTNRADVAAALTAKPETPAQEVARNGLLNQVAQWGDQQNTLARARAIDTLYSDRALDSQPIRSEIANRTEQIGKIENTIADYGRIMRGEEPLNYAVQRQVDTVLSDRAPWTAERVMTEGVVGRYVTDTLTGWARSMSDAGIPALVNPVAWVAGISDSALALGDNPTASRQFSELSMLSHDYYATRVLDVINVATVVDPMLGNPGMRALSEGIQFARAAEFYGATFAGREMPFGAGFATRETVAPNFGSVATDLEFTQIRPGVWAYADDIANAERTAAITETRLLTGPAEVPAAGPISEVRMLPAPVDGAPTGVFANADTRIVVADLATPWEQLPTWAQNAFLERGYVPPTASIVERAGLGEVAALDRPFIETPVTRAPEILEPVAMRDVVPESAPRLAESPRVPETLVAERPVLEFTLAPEAPPTQPLVRVADTVPPVTAVETPRVASPAITPASEIPSSPPTFTERVRDFFGFGPPPPVAPISPLEAVAISNFNNALSDYSRIENRTDVSPFTRSAILKDVSDSYRALSTAGLYQSARDGSITRENGDVLAARLPVHVPGNAPYYTTVPLLAATVPSEAGATPNPVLVATDDELRPTLTVISEELPPVMPDNPQLTQINPAVSQNPNIASGVPARGTLPGEIAPTRDIFRKIMTGPATAGLLSIAALSNPAFTTAADAASPNFNTCIARNCLQPVAGPTSFYDPRKGGINIDPRYVVGNSALTKSGEPVSMAANSDVYQHMTMASERYPVNTIVYTCNGPTCVYVRVNDTGSFERYGRVGDLMPGPVRALGFDVNRGVVPISQRPIVMFAGPNGQHRLPVNQIADGVMRDLNRGVPLATALDNAAKTAPMPFTYTLPNMTTAYTVSPGSTPGTALAGVQAPAPTIAGNAPQQPAPAVQRPAAAPQPVVVAPPPPPPTASEVTQQLEQRILQQIQQRGLDTTDPVSRRIQQQLDQTNDFARRANRTPVFPQSVPAPVQSPIPANVTTAPPQSPVSVATRSVQPPPAVAVQPYAQLGGEALAQTEMKIQQEWVQQMRQRGFQVVEAVNPNGVYYRQMQPYEKPVSPMVFPVSHVTYTSTGAQIDAQRSSQIDVRPVFGRAAFGAHMFIDNCASGKCTIYLSAPFNQRVNHVAGAAQYRINGAPEAYNWNSLAIEISAPNEAAVTPAAAGTLAEAVRAFGEVSGQPQFSQNIVSHQKVNPKSPGEGEKGVAAVLAAPQNLAYRPQWMATQPRVAVAPAPAPLSLDVIQPGFAGRPATAAQAEAVLRDIEAIIPADRNFNIGNPTELAALNRALTARGYPPIMPPRSVKPFGVHMQTVGMIQGKTLQVFAGTQAILGQSFPITAATESGHSTRHGGPHAVGSAIDFEAAPFDIGNHVFSVPRAQRAVTPLPYDSTSVQFQKYRAVIGATTGYVAGRMCSFGGATTCAVTMGVYPGFGTHLDTIAGIANTYNQGLRVTSPELQSVIARYQNQSQTRITFDEVSVLAQNAGFVDRAPYTIANRGNPNLTAGTPARNIAQVPPAVTPAANQPMPPAALAPSVDQLPTLVLPRMTPDVAANVPRGRVEPQTVLEPAPTPVRTWTPLISPRQPLSVPSQPARTETVRLVNAPIPNGDVLVATTPGYTPLKPTNVVVYFHGHSSRYVNAGIEDSIRRQQILEQLKGTNSILVIPELGPLSNPGQLGTPGGFYRMMTEVGQRIQASYGAPTATAFNAAPVTVVAYSGGHAPALAVANNGYVSRFQRVVLMDAGYGSNFASGWADWLTRNPNATLVSGYLRGTSVRNLQLVAELQQRGITLSTQAPAGQPGRAFVYNAPATIGHHEFMQRAWVPAAVSPNISVAQAPQRLSTIPPQPPATVTQPLVRAETVPVISRATPPPSNPAQLAQPHMTPVGNQPFAIGDSVANLLVRQGGLRGAALDGLSPQRVLDVIRNLPAETLRGRTVYLSSGASNTGGDIAQVQRIVPQQVAALRAAGAQVVLLGVGPRMPAAMNDVLKQIAAQNQGTRFSALPTTYDGIHPRTARELLASINAQAPAPTVAVNPPTVTPPIAIRPVVTIPIVNPPTVTPPVVTPPTVTPPAVTPPAVTPPVVIVPVVTRPVVNPPAVTPPATPRIATAPVPVPLPKPRIAPSRTEPTPAPVVQAPAQTPTPPAVAPTTEMNNLQSQIARVEGERRALTDRLQQLKEFPNTRQLNDLARRGLESLRKDSQPTPGDIAAMGAGQNAVAQLERAARLAGDITTANQLAQMRGTLSTLSGLGKQLADVVQRQYNGSYTAAYFAGNPLLARVMALRTNALSTGDALVRAMEGKNFTAAVQTQTTQVTTRIAQIDQQLAAQRAELSRLAQVAQTPSVPNQPQPAPVPVQVTVTPPLQLPPLALDLTPPTPASNMPAQVPVPGTPGNPGQFPLGPLVPVYRTPRIVTELPPAQTLSSGTVPPSPEPVPQLSQQIEQLLAVFAERMKNRPALSTGENIPAVGSIDPSPAPVFASEPTATEVQLATAARDARDHGPLAQANPGDLLPKMALPNTEAPLIISPRAAAAIDAPIPARTPPQIVLETVTVNGREMLTRESGIRLVETLYESSPELQALRVVQARATGKEIFSVEQMRGLADAVGQSLAARTGVRFELIRAVELSPGIYGPPATLPSDTTLTPLYYKNGVPIADNGGSWSQSANTVYFYEELAQVPGTFINELIHETGAVLLGREFGGKENIPKVLLDPVDQFAMYATHLLDHEVGTRTPGQVQSPTAIAIEQRALGPVASAPAATPDLPFTPSGPVTSAAPAAPAPAAPGTAAAPTTPGTPVTPTTPVATPKVETSTLALNVLKGSLWPADTWKRNAALYPFTMGMAMTGGTILATPIVNVAWKSLFNPAYRNDVKLLSSRAWGGLKSLASRAPIIPAISKAFAPATSTPKPTTPTTPTPGVPAAPTGGNGGNVPPTDARPWKSFADGWNPSSLFSPETNRKIMRYGPLAGVFGLLALLPSDTPQSTVPPTTPPTSASESPADCTQELLDYQNAMRALLSIAPTTRCNEPLPDAPATTPTPTPTTPPTVGSYVPGPGVASYSPTNPDGSPVGAEGTPSPMQRLASLLSGMMPSLARLLGGQNQTPTPTTPTPLPDTTGRTATTTPMPIMAEIIARPNPVVRGASTTVSWYSVSATLCRVFSASSSQQIATGTPNGSFPINPALATSTFRVTCQNDAGQTATSATTIYIR